MNDYTVITFAPVQGFIEKSRKLRDLHGSSYILSLLSWVICQSVEKQGNQVVSPALPNVTQGMPNQIIVKGELLNEQIETIQTTFIKAWKCVIDSCREWIEEEINQWDYLCWGREWKLWINHCWEFFWASGNTITSARQNLNQKKYSRDWTGINWQGESSTLSGSDAICQPLLGEKKDPRDYNYQQEKTLIKKFYGKLSEKLGEAFIDTREELSIPELVKRMITNEIIIDKIESKLQQLELNLSANQIRELSKDLNPDSFRDLNRQKNDANEQKYWTGWFLGDGDSASKYFQTLALNSSQEEETELNKFSKEMREWGRDLQKNQENYLKRKGRMIYAGGDDFLGVLYDGALPFHATDNQAKLAPYDCLNFFYNFKSNIWQKPTPKIITASVGFVWAGNQVPQRDILQHCHLAEQSAKNTGRDRIAFRILFNSGNYLEWVTPWWLLDTEEWNFDDSNNDSNNIRKIDFSEQLKLGLKEVELNLIESYRDRNGIFLSENENPQNQPQIPSNKQGNWTHFYQDIAILESRHAFNKRKFSEVELELGNIKVSNDIALGLIEIYFGKSWKNIIGNYHNWFNKYDENGLQTFSGILGNPQQFEPNYQENSENREKLKSKPEVKQALNNWVINLAKIGFYLTETNPKTNLEK